MSQPAASVARALHARLVPDGPFVLRAALLFACIGLLAGALALVSRVPVVGVADNGDFWRVMSPAGLAHTAPLSTFQHRFVRSELRVLPARWAEHPSSPAIVAWTAKHAARAFSGQSARRAATANETGGALADVRLVGGSYLFLLAVAMVPLVGALPGIVARGLFVLWVITDPGYVLFFNSLYADPAAMIAVAALCVWLSRWGVPAQGVPVAQLTSVLVFILLGAFAKLQYSLIGLALLAALLPGLKARRLGVGASVLAALVVAMAVLLPAYFLWGGGHRFEPINRFHRVYRGVAEVSDEPARTLASLELGRETARLVGRSWFDPGLSDAERRLPQHVSPLKVALVYLTEPRMLGRAASRVARTLAWPRSTLLGQYTAEESGGGARHFEPSAWHFSRWRPILLGAPLAVAAWLALSTGWLVANALRRRWTSESAALFFLLLVVLTQAIAAVVGDGFFALGRHLLLGRFALDLTAGLLAFDLVSRIRFARC